MTIEWIDGPGKCASTVVVDARAPGLELVRAMSARLTTVADEVRPCSACCIAVPLGTIALEGIDAEGRVLWSRDVSAEGPRARVVIDSP